MFIPFISKAVVVGLISLASFSDLKADNCIDMVWLYAVNQFIVENMADRFALTLPQYVINYMFIIFMLNLQILGSGGTIIWVMLLSVVFLKVKYQLRHIAGAGVCLLGIGTLAYADISSGKSNNGNIQLNEIMIHK